MICWNMKRYIRWVMVLFVVLFGSQTVWGQISASSTQWTRDTIKTSKTISFGASHTGEITINGQIVISGGATLTIKFAKGYPANTNKVIRAVPNSRGNAFARMFKIEKGGKLVIQGRDENSRIILDGGARFSGGINDKQLLTITDAGGVTVHTPTNPAETISDELIYSNSGSLTLRWVTLQNVFASGAKETYVGDNKYGGAIHLTGTVDDDDEHQTLLENCIIENCADHCGGAMAIRMSNNNAPKDTYPENTRVTLTNTEIRYCYTSSTSGGTIRANGRTINDVVLNNINIHHNYAEASGAGILWNGGGSTETDLQINGGSFHHNVSDSKGGAMSIAANVSFTGDVIIEHNHSKTDGGGISIHTYDGVVMPKRDDKTYSFTYTFPKGLIIRNNTSKKGGGIAYNVNNFAIYKDWETDPQTGVVINTTIDLQGAEISNNTAEEDGGGIWLANNLETGWVTRNEATANIYVHLNSGSIRNNTSLDGNGAGVFLYKTDISHIAAKAGTLSLDGNLANGSEKNGGGIYIEDGKTINLSNVTTEIKNNQASNGGAIYINSTSDVQVTLGNSTISSNAVTGSGGALYIKGGSLTLGKVDVTSNTAASHGGAVYVDGGDIIINGEGSTFSSNEVTGDNMNGGAAYVKGDFYVNGSTTMSSNHSAYSGGAIYIKGGNLILADSRTLTLKSNSTGGNGGAICVNTGRIDGENASIVAGGASDADANTATEYEKGKGGAIYVYKGDIHIKDCYVQRNSATAGGGIHVSGGSFIANGKVVIDGNIATTTDGGGIYCEGSFAVKGGASIQNNSANRSGGAIYVNTGNIEFSGSSSMLQVVGNHAGDGGAIYVNGGNIVTENIQKAIITGNYATNEGGAFYVTKGNIEMGLTELADNGKNGTTACTVNGGAIALYDGVFTFADGSEIKNNMATGNGGALYIKNAGTQKSISCEGGSYVGNTASGDGGAIYASGDILLKVTADVRNNIAKNGGGLYLDGGVNMTFGNKDISGLGLIVGNKAIGTSAKEGVGGGIYMAKGVLSFADQKNLGIYNNVATYEAADIYSSGKESLVNLPNVSGMNLTGFHVPGNDLYWVVDEHGNRYEDALLDVSKDLNLLTFSGATMEVSEEICLDLGYDYVLVTIIVRGLDISHDASVVLSYPDNGIYQEYRNVLFTGMGKENEVRRIVGLPSHNWKFDITDWSYKYDEITCSPDDENDKIIPISRAGTREVTITFKSGLKSNIKDFGTRKVNILRPKNG